MKQKILSLTKKDFEISFYSGSGAGGQHRNKHKNCVRIYHRPSECLATGADCKSKTQNKKNAFKRLTSKKSFQSWLKLEINKKTLDLESIETAVDTAMEEKNLLVEYF